MKKIFYCFIILLIFYLAIFLVFYSEQIVCLVSGKYPAFGSYYITFMLDEEQNIVADVSYFQNIYIETIDLSNLDLYISDSGHYNIDKDQIYSDSEIRKMLLEQGLAKIIDKNIASKDEIKCENQAIKEENGIWKTQSDNKSLTLHSIFEKILFFLYSNLWSFIKWIVFSVIGISTICNAIKKILSKKR